MDAGGLQGQGYGPHWARESPLMEEEYHFVASSPNSRVPSFNIPQNVKLNILRTPIEHKFGLHYPGC
jgi:hypothetical protein